MTRCIRLAIVNLAGIPSIVYGLFGLGMFVLFLKMGTSILAGALTLAIMTRINLSGLWFDKPRLMTGSEDSLGWWDRSGNFDVSGLGQIKRYYGYTFASESKREAELWTAGALAILASIHAWSKR